MTDKTRERFEKWAKTKSKGLRAVPDDSGPWPYDSAPSNAAWEAYQAATAELLPVIGLLRKALYLTSSTLKKITKDMPHVTAAKELTNIYDEAIAEADKLLGGEG